MSTKRAGTGEAARRVPRDAAAFTGAYMVAFGALAAAQGNREFLFYLAVMLVLIGMVWAVHARVGFSRGVVWLLAVWGLMHMAGGTVPIPERLTDGEGALPVLYSLRPAPWLPRYDQWTHVFGFFSATLASAQALRAATRPARIGVGFACAAGLMGMGFGALNEVVEFIATRLLAETNVGGYVNTGWDLVSNAIGAAIGMVVVARWPNPADGTQVAD
jgi:VanZ family protein